MKRLTYKDDDGYWAVAESGKYSNFGDLIDKLAAYEDLEEFGRLMILPCTVGDPLYYIADEDDEGNEIPTVKEVDGGIRAVIITDTGIRVADYAELAQIVNYSNEIGTRYAYLSPEDAAAAVKGVGDE